MTGYRDIKLVSETWLVAGQAFPEYSSPPPPAYQLHLVDTADESNHPEMVLKLESPDIWGRRKSSFYALLSGESMLYNKNPPEGYRSLPQPEDMITTLISSTDTESNEVVYSVSMLISKLLEFGNSPSRRRTIEWTEWKRYAIPMEGFGTRCCFCVNFSMSGRSLVWPNPEGVLIYTFNPMGSARNSSQGTVSTSVEQPTMTTLIGSQENSDVAIVGEHLLHVTVWGSLRLFH